MKKNLKIYLFFTLIMALPIIIANVYYSDDMSRAMSGVTYWGIDGRPLSDRLMIMLNFNSHLSDLAPLPLIMACVLLSLSFYMIHEKIFNGENHFALLPVAFFLSPFLIEPLSYRFDSLTISASIFMAFAYISIRHKVGAINYMISSALIVMLFCLYQPTINIALILVSIEFFREIQQRKLPSKILKTLLFRVCTIATGAIVYMKVILPLTHVNNNSQNHPGVASNLLNIVRTNANAYYDFYTTNTLPVNGGAVVLLSFIISLLLVLFLSFNYYKQYRTKLSALVCAISTLAVPLTFVASMISLLLLENPLTTFARVYIGINALTLFIFTLLYLCIKNTKITNVILFVCVTYIVTFYYSYGNVLRAQDDKNKNVANVIGFALKDVKANMVNIMFDGASPKSPVLLNSIQNYPLFKTIVLDYFYNWYGSHVYLKIRGVEQKYPDFNRKETLSFMKSYCLQPAIYTSNEMNIYRDGDNVMVSFNGSSCN